jgi:ArsR family transcriptional regulator
MKTAPQVRSSTRPKHVVRPASNASFGPRAVPLADTATLFRAFADETRLRILNLLLEGEVCVCDLCDALDVLQPSISRHLAYLDRAGLVTVRQSGKWKYYRAVRLPDAARRRLLGCLKACLRDLDVLTRDLDRLRRLQAQPGHCC